MPKSSSYVSASKRLEKDKARHKKQQQSAGAALKAAKAARAAKPKRKVPKPKESWVSRLKGAVKKHFAKGKSKSGNINYRKQSLKNAVSDKEYKKLGGK